MFLLGSERVVTQDFKTHGVAEDYAGEHLSIIKIKGKAKVTKVINKYIPHQDTINYNDFFNNKDKWQEGTYYNCISITGKKVRYHQSELGGNQVELECYESGKKRYIKILHMASTPLNVGDIINSNTVIGYQGNTGLVLSKKAKTDVTYGSNVHLEIRDENYKPLNPRDYAIYVKDVDYLEQTNVLDNTKDQIKIIVNKINIRSEPTVSSSDIGDVYNGEIYDILGITEDDKYIWYKIKTSLGLIGYVASEKGKEWIEVILKNNHPKGDIPGSDEVKKINLIFTCKKDGMYAIKLKNGEQLYIG